MAKQHAITAHELAAQLLEGPDKPVQLQVNTDTTGFWGPAGSVYVLDDSGEPKTTLFTYAEDKDE